MIRLVRVKFANGKTAEFDAEAFPLEAGDSVLVDTEKGVGLGKVTSSPYEKEFCTFLLLRSTSSHAKTS